MEILETPRPGCLFDAPPGSVQLPHLPAPEEGARRGLESVDLGARELRHVFVELDEARARGDDTSV